MVVCTDDLDDDADLTVNTHVEDCASLSLYVGQDLEVQPERDGVPCSVVAGRRRHSCVGGAAVHQALHQRPALRQKGQKPSSVFWACVNWSFLIFYRLSSAYTGEKISNWSDVLAVILTGSQK